MMRTILVPVLAAIAGAAAAAAPPDPAAWRDAATRFAQTAANDPAYTGALAAYCRLLLGRIEGLPGDRDLKAVDRSVFGSSGFALGGSGARVGHGWWPENYREAHVLDDGPFWWVRTGSNVLLSGRGVVVELNPDGTRASAVLVGLTRQELEEAAAGRGLRERRWTEPEFPPLAAELRPSDLPFQYDVWMPGRAWRSGQPIPVYTVLRSRLNTAKSINGWRTLYEHQLGPQGIEGVKGPDGREALDFGVYRVLGGKRSHVPVHPGFLNAQFDFFWEPRLLVPPHGVMVYAILLDRAFDVSAPGDYEVWANYPSDNVNKLDDPDMFRGHIPAPPVSFRVLASWRATVIRGAMITLPAALLLVAGWFLRRRRAYGA